MTYQRRQKVQTSVRQLLSPDSQDQNQKQPINSPIRSENRRKLQQQFYEDHNLLIADQVIQQVLSKAENKSDGPPIENSIPQIRQLFRKNFKEVFLQQIDPREREKYKLQNRKEQFFSFNDHLKKDKPIYIPVSDKSPSTEAKVKLSDKIKTERKQQKMESPFGRESLFLQQKRVQQQKIYAEALLRQIQQKRKMKKQQHIQGKNKNIIPFKVRELDNAKESSHQGGNKFKQASPRGRGKIDPNGKPPKLTHYVGDSDLMYIENKVAELKFKLKKGRIDEEEFKVDINKIQNFYGKPLSELIPNNKLQQMQVKQPKKVEKIVIRQKDILDSQAQQIKPDPSQLKQKIVQNYNNPSPNVSLLAKSQHFNRKYRGKGKISSKIPEVQNKNIQEQLLVVERIGSMQMGIMKQMLQEMRQVYRSNIINQQHFLNEALMRYSMQQFPIYKPSQTEMKQFIINLRNQRSDSDRMQEPMNTQHRLDDDSIQSSVRSLKQIQNFYRAPYRVLPFKNFQYIEGIDESSIEMPSSSKKQTLGQGKADLRRQIQWDLQRLKKIHKLEEVTKVEQINKKKKAQIPQQESLSAEYSQVGINKLNKVSQFNNKRPNTFIIESNEKRDISPTFNNFFEFDTGSYQPSNPTSHIDITERKQIRKIKTNKKQKYQAQRVIKRIDRKGRSLSKINVSKKQAEAVQEQPLKREETETYYAMATPPRQKKEQYPNSKVSSLENSSRLHSSKTQHKKESEIRIKVPLYIHHQQINHMSVPQNTDGYLTGLDTKGNSLLDNNQIYKEQLQHDRRLQFNKPVVIQPRIYSESKLSFGRIHDGSVIKSLSEARQMVRQHQSDRQQKSLIRQSFQDRLLKAEEYIKSRSQATRQSGKYRQTYSETHNNIKKILHDLEDSNQGQQATDYETFL